jgi:thiamine pyrophosphate-dependent acetolactate synthase large subunit-like protein
MSEGRYGSDVIVALLSEAGIEHVAFNPGASFRGIHDSLVHTSPAPRIALCLHEGVSVALAQGYAKAAGKPMAVLLHDVVGLQNASMAIYNAWCDRVPILLLGGTGPKSKPRRRPWIDWIHTASVQAELIRNFVKWDDEPHDLASVPESLARGLTAASSAPQGPVYLCYDASLQEDAVTEGLAGQGIAGYPTPTDPAPSADDVNALLSALRASRLPVILAGYVGERDSSFAGLGELARRLGAAVIDTGARLALPTDHPLNATGIPELLAETDVVLALDVDDLRGPLGARLGDGSHPGDVVVLNVGTGHLKLRGWSDDHQPLVPSRMHVTSTAAAALEALTLRLSELGAPAGADDRTTALMERIRSAREERRSAAAAAEDEGAVPLERLIVELDDALGGVEFTLTNATTQPLDPRLWTLSRPRQALGWAGGGGLGYGVGAAIGAALANGPGTVSVVLQADGDLLYLPAALWTAANLRLQVLVVVHNNRQYANTVGHAARIARARGRSDLERHAGAGLTDPEVDIGGLASSFGVWSSGPVRDVPSLRNQLAQAIECVQAGRPALVDVITPGL